MIEEIEEVDYGNHKSLYYLSIIIGYSYAAFWGISFLNIIHLNYKLKNVEGCNLDFVIYNVQGFLFYTAYTGAGYFYPDKTGIVAEGNDLAFGVWSLVMTILIFIQCFCMYPRFSNKVTNLCIVISSFYWLSSISHYLCYAVFEVYEVSEVYFNIWYIFSYHKLLITLTKYIPQAYWNYVRQSTAGWSHHGVLLDELGGILCIVQIFIEHINGDNSIMGSGDDTQGHGSGLNIAKIGLAVISIGFDTLFLIQHYVFYNPKKIQARQKQQELEDKSSSASAISTQASSEQIIKQNNPKQQSQTPGFFIDHKQQEKYKESQKKKKGYAEMYEEDQA